MCRVKPLYYEFKRVNPHGEIFLAGTMNLRPNNPDCCVCRPQTYHIPGVEDSLDQESTCARCLLSTRESYNLAQAEEKVGEKENLTVLDYTPAKQSLKGYVIRSLPFCLFGWFIVIL